MFDVSAYQTSVCTALDDARAGLVFGDVPYVVHTEIVPSVNYLHMKLRLEEQFAYCCPSILFYLSSDVTQGKEAQGIGRISSFRCMYWLLGWIEVPQNCFEVD